MAEGACRHVHCLVRPTSFGWGRINRVQLLVNIPINTSLLTNPSTVFPYYGSFFPSVIYRFVAVKVENWKLEIVCIVHWNHLTMIFAKDIDFMLKTFNRLSICLLSNCLTFDYINFHF